MDGEWVQIIHPETGGTGEVHRDSLPAHYASGWRLLSDDEAAALAVPEPEPPPMTREQAAQAAEQASEPEPEEM